MTVNQLMYYHTVLLVFKIRSSQEPEYLAEILSKDSRNSRIIIPNLDLKLAQKSFTLRGADSWNKVPISIRQNAKIGLFKRQLRKWVYENIPRFLD